MPDKIKKLEVSKIDSIKANWDVSDAALGLDIEGNQIELPEHQQIFIHLLLKVEELEARVKVLEDKP